MQFAGRLNEQDIAEARALLHSKGYQARVAVTALRVLLVVGLLAWLTIRFLQGPTRPHWTVIGVPWLIVLGIAGLTVFRFKRMKARVVAQVSRKMPDWIELNDDGVQTSGPDGATSFHPWASIKGWREGHRVILLLLSKTAALAILPVGELSEAARQPLRDLLKSHIVASPGIP